MHWKSTTHSTPNVPFLCLFSYVMTFEYTSEKETCLKLCMNSGQSMHNDTPSPPVVSSLQPTEFDIVTGGSRYQPPPDRCVGSNC